MDDIVKEAREAIEASHTADRDNRREALEDLRFTAGFQWSDAARTERAGRPMITINRSGQFLRQVSNPIRQNMPTIKVETDNDDSSDMAEIANGMLRRIQYNSSASHVYAQSVEHMVACGIGWFRIVTDYLDQESFEQELLIKRIFNPLSVYPDPGAMEPDRSDMQWCLVSEMITPEAFKAKYPKMRAESIDAPSSLGNGVITWNSSDKVRVAEYWKRKEVPKTIALLADGSVVDLTGEGEKNIRELKAAGIVVNIRKVKGYKTQMTLVSGADQLEDTYDCPCKWIPIVPVIGAEIPLETGTYRHGLIRFQREPQQLHNYFMSVAAETLGQQPRVPYLVTQKQIQNYKALWDSANRRATPYLPYDPDPSVPGGIPQRVDPPPLPSALVQMAQLMSDDMKAATGVYDASLGAKSNETSGVAIAQRQAQGDNATAHFVDNLEHSLEHTGRILLDMMPKIYDSERTMRLIGEDDAEKSVTINKPIIKIGDVELKHNDMSQMRFNSVRVVLGPSYASRRAQAVQDIVSLTQAVPQVGAMGADIIVRNMDFEGSEELAERLKKANPLAQQDDDEGNPQQQQPDPMQQAQMQHAGRMMEAQAAKAEAEAEKARAQAAQEIQTVQVDEQQAVANLQGTYLDNQLKQQRLSNPPPAQGRTFN